VQGRGPILATVSVTGACVLVVEIAGARVVSPLYGSGLYSWSAMISVTLAALSLGYWAGGRSADRRPDPARFHGGILLAGLLVLAIPALAPGVLRLTEPLDPRLGVLLATTLLFFAPLAILGGVTPFAIRLARPPAGEVGSASGLVFAVSTIGSLLGALAAGFLLIPNVGLRAILTLSGSVLVLTAALGFLAGGRRVQAAALLIVAAAAPLAPLRTTGAGASTGVRILENVPSFYGSLRVIETETHRLLTVDGIGQNYVALDPAAEPHPYLAFLGALPRLQRPSPERPTALVIGLGAGELIRVLEDSRVEVTAVELDPRVEQVARRHFGLALPAGRVRIADGRAFLQRDRASHGFVFLDAFLGEDVPGHLFTREAFQAVRARLDPGGLLGINYTTIPGGRDVAAVATTLASVFRHVRAFTDGSAPSELATLVLVASDAPIVLQGDDDASAGARFILAHEFPLAALAGTVLTDDHNPINAFRLGTNRVWRRNMMSFVGADPALWSDL
jgi:spermidine synthase